MIYRCAVCLTDLLVIKHAAVTPVEHIDADRQMRVGVCFGCQRLRHGAAIAYEQAANEVSLLTRLGLNFAGKYGRTPLGRWTSGTSYLTHALNRMEAARYRCEELKMWPAVWLPPRESETK